jgi:hypothetical protein
MRLVKSPADVQLQTLTYHNTMNSDTTQVFIYLFIHSLTYGTVKDAVRSSYYTALKGKMIRTSRAQESGHDLLTIRHLTRRTDKNNETPVIKTGLQAKF